MNQRPIGITLLAILAWFNGLWAICTGALALGILSTGGLGSVLGVSVSGGFGVASLYSLIWGVIAFLVGFGLWQKQMWAWTTTMVLQGINVIFVLITLITPEPVNWLSAVISLIIIGYLLRPQIRAAFG